MKNTMWASITDLEGKEPFKMMNMVNLHLYKPNYTAISYIDEQGEMQWLYLDTNRYSIDVYALEPFMEEER